MGNRQQTSVSQLTSEGPIPGYWRLVGVTPGRIEWEASLELRADSDGYRGTLLWKRNGTEVGTEWVRCSFDPATREFAMSGHDVEGEIVTANYRAILADDRRQMDRGDWIAACGTGATWHAVLVEDTAEN